MKLHVWKNAEGIYLTRPPRPATLEEIDFDPDLPCQQCGEAMLSISGFQSDVCAWCESSTNRPRMLRYQELEIIQRLKQQSEENRDSLPDRTRNLIRNGVTEKDLRNYLSANGYAGRSARVMRLELTAVERPGWVQVFDFHVYAKEQSGGWRELHGVIRADERSNQFEVSYYDGASRSDVVRSATRGLITGERGPRHWSYWPLMTLAGLMLGAAIAGAVLTPESQSTPTATSAYEEAP